MPLPLIQGRQAQSKEEVMFAQALASLGIDFQFQVPINRGFVAGGYYLDFLVYVPPRPVPCPLYSEYYHKNELSNEDIARLTIIENIFGKAVIFWAEEFTNIAEAESLIEERLL